MYSLVYVSGNENSIQINTQWQLSEGAAEEQITKSTFDKQLKVPNAAPPYLLLVESNDGTHTAKGYFTDFVIQPGQIPSATKNTRFVDLHAQHHFMQMAVNYGACLVATGAALYHNQSPLLFLPAITTALATVASLLGSQLVAKPIRMPHFDFRHAAELPGEFMPTSAARSLHAASVAGFISSNPFAIFAGMVANLAPVINGFSSNFDQRPRQCEIATTHRLRIQAQPRTALPLAVGEGNAQHNLPTARAASQQPAPTTAAGL